MPVAAAISGTASIGSAIIGANAAKSASAAQAAAQQEALKLQKSMFLSADSALSPYYKAGAGALPTLNALITPGTSADTLATLPGFQFMSKYGTRTATNALAARGLGGSAGPVGRAISDYNTGLAGTYWKDAVNALQGFANMGAGAAGNLGGVAGNFAGMIGTTMGKVGDAQASGILGSANALSGGLMGAGNSAVNAMLYSKMLGGGGGGGDGLYGDGNMFPSMDFLNPAIPFNPTGA